MKHSLLLSLLLFVCFSVYGQTSSVPSQRVTTNSLQTTITSLQDSIQRLHAHNQNLQMQIKDIKEDIKNYREDFRYSVSEYNDKMDLWINKLSIILAITGLFITIFSIIIPFQGRHDLEKKINDINTQINEARGIKTDVEKTANEAKAFQQFIKAINEEDIDKAIDYYDLCIVLNPNFAEAYNNRGVLYLKKGKMEEAENDFNEAISKGYVEAHLNLGLLNCQRGEKDKAKKDFDAAITNKGDYAEAYYIRGLWRYINGEVKEGIDDIRKAREKKPKIVESFSNRSLLKDEMKDLDNSINGAEYLNNMTTIKHVSNEKEGAFIILNCVKEICHDAFANCSKITSIDISNSCLTTINENAFNSCTSLTAIEIPNSVTAIGKCAFWGCTNLASAIISNKVKKIDKGTFFQCTKLTSIEIPDGVEEICDGAFENCSKLKSIEISKSVNTIESGAFKGCTSLEAIHLKHSTPPTFSDAFEDLDTKKVTIYVPSSSGEAYGDNCWGFNIIKG